MKITDGRLRLSASDIANHLACPHLTQLDRQKAQGRLRPPHERDIGLEDLVRRGEVHERAVLARFRADGHEVVAIGVIADAEAVKATAEAIRAGVQLIYQGTLTGSEPGHGPALFGRPDFLVRADLLPAPDGEPRPDGVHYEVVDAKLARSAKARAVLQTAFYSHLLAGLQLGVEPRWMHLALGDGEFTSFKVSEYAAYERQTRRRLEASLGGNPPPDPYPEPVEHCAICRWSERCADRRRRDDDLSLVAGMPSGQRRELKDAGISTRREFAGLAVLPVLSRVSPAALERAHRQARLQVASDDGHIRYEILEPDRDAEGALVANRGLAALPEPAAGDLFFDIEGARYYSQDGREFGLQYLFGVVDTAEADEAGQARYTQIWAFDRPGEKHAFEQLIDFITERRAAHPGLHVYHYNHYEPTSVDHLTELHGTRQEAVGALMGRFATREEEVDNLFRLGVFVDLYRVVRQGVRAGVESYSIKRLEPLAGYTRQVDLHEATRSLIALEAALEDGTAAGDLERQRVVAGYNEDDCRATLALRDWLEERRAELAGRLGEGLPRPAFAEKPAAPEDPELARIRSALLAGVSAETPEGQARTLLADLLDWHRREDKPGWWRYFYLRTLSPAELTGEPDALGGLAGGDVVGQVKRSVVRRFSFPPQEHKFSRGGVARDPATDKQWSIHAVDDARGTIDLKVGRTTTMSNEQLEQALRAGELDVAAGTSWLWARAGLAASVDTLFIEEAGQLSLAGVLAVAGAARNLVLLGDPQQLAQPSQATHPPGAGASALKHILGDRATMPADAGLLLDQTYRMHPDLCRYTSEAFYDGKLHGVPGLGNQMILGEGPSSEGLSGAGLRVVKVPHQGNTNASPEEAGEVARLVGQLARSTWQDKDGLRRPVGPGDVLIVTPYNAQIRAIQAALAASGHDGFMVGTVDKFQGREAPVVIYSMATSLAGDAPRGLEFLYDPHRLNVATSRARALAMIVASPDLIRVSCRTPRQMSLVNALCRAWESP